MQKTYLTSAERMSLKHIFGLDSQTIEKFESLNLDDETRSFIIINMMAKSVDNAKGIGIEKTENKKDYSTYVVLGVVLLCAFVGAGLGLLFG